jgi:hypothetical protein
MKNIEIAESLEVLRPGSEWVLSGDDYSKIQWLDEKTSAPTLAEIQAKIAELPQIKAQKEAEKAAKKAALLEKLGITEAEAKLLLS